MEVAQKIETRTPRDPAVPRLTIYPKETQTLTRKGTCAHVPAAAFTIAETPTQRVSTGSQADEEDGYYTCTYTRTRTRNGGSVQP